MRLRSGYERRRARVEMIPLIDIVFLLLVFFIYAMLSMVVHRGVKVTLPAPRTAQIDRRDYVGITIDADNSIYFDEQKVTAAELPALVKARPAREGRRAGLRQRRRARGPRRGHPRARPAAAGGRQGGLLREHGEAAMKRPDLALAVFTLARAPRDALPRLRLLRGGAGALRAGRLGRHAQHHALRGQPRRPPPEPRPPQPPVVETPRPPEPAAEKPVVQPPTPPPAPEPRAHTRAAAAAAGAAARRRSSRRLLRRPRSPLRGRRLPAQAVRPAHAKAPPGEGGAGDRRAGAGRRQLRRRQRGHASHTASARPRPAVEPDAAANTRSTRAATARRAPWWWRWRSCRPAARPHRGRAVQRLLAPGPRRRRRAEEGRLHGRAPRRRPGHDDEAVLVHLPTRRHGGAIDARFRGPGPCWSWSRWRPASLLAYALGRVQPPSAGGAGSRRRAGVERRVPLPPHHLHVAGHGGDRLRHRRRAARGRASASTPSWPPEATKLPICGGFFNPNYERILSLRPDLIISQGEATDLRKFARQQRHRAGAGPRRHAGRHPVRHRAARPRCCRWSRRRSAWSTACAGGWTPCARACAASRSSASCWSPATTRAR